MVENKDAPPVLFPGPDVDRVPLVAPSLGTKNPPTEVRTLPIAKLLVGVSVDWSAAAMLFSVKYYYFRLNQHLMNSNHQILNRILHLPM